MLKYFCGAPTKIYLQHTNIFIHENFPIYGTLKCDKCVCALYFVWIMNTM